jgi:hypothetical protein
MIIAIFKFILVLIIGSLPLTNGKVDKKSFMFYLVIWLWLCVELFLAILF